MSRLNRRKSLEEKKAAGTPLRQKTVPQGLLLTKIPKPPPKFSKAARELWRDVCRKLIARQLLTETAIYTVEQFVLLQLAAREAMTNTKATAGQKLSLMREARLAGEELGLSPSAHAKVVKPTDVRPDSADDARWAEIINQ